MVIEFVQYVDENVFIGIDTHYRLLVGEVEEGEQPVYVEGMMIRNLGLKLKIGVLIKG